MTDFKSQFDAQAKILVEHVSAMPGRISDELPGMSNTDFGRLMSSIGRMLGRLDKSAAKSPEYLTYNSMYLPAYAVSFLGIATQYTANGAQYFVNNAMPQFAEINSRLEKAVGIDAEVVRGITQSQISELQQILDQSRKILHDIGVTRRHADDVSISLAKLSSATEQRANDANSAVETIKSSRGLVERLIGDKANKDSLEKLGRLARDKYDSISITADSVNDLEIQANSAVERANTLVLDITEIQIKIDNIQQKAEGILHGATQAGLAGAYKSERDRLALEQRNCTLIFYGGTIAIVLYAAIFILPIISKLLENGSSVHLSASDAAIVLLEHLSS